MARITKGMIEAAYFNLEGIREMITDPMAFQGRHATTLFHARSASNYIETLEKGKKTLPNWIIDNAKYYRAAGWHIPQGY